MKNKKLIKFYAFVARWTIILAWPIWPKSQLPLILDAFETLDKYYGKVMDPEERIQLLLDKVSLEERIAIYQYTLDRVNLAIRLKELEQADPASHA